MKPNVGQKVTCRFPEPAYYSDYGLNKGRQITFRPGMVGTVVAIVPKVSMPPKGQLPSGRDRKPEFVVVDYLDEGGEKQRVGLDFCNVTPATKGA